MSMNRRDLLKHFGIGTIIVPAAAVAASETAPRASLVELPVIEPVKLVTSLELIKLSQVKSVELSFAMFDGTTRRISIPQPRLVSDDQFLTIGGEINLARTTHVDLRISQQDLFPSPSSWYYFGQMNGKGYAS